MKKQTKKLAELDKKRAGLSKQLNKAVKDDNKLEQADLIARMFELDDEFYKQLGRIDA